MRIRNRSAARTISAALLAGSMCVAVGVVSGSAEPARAATLYAMDMAELVRTSDYVVVARPGSRTSRKAQGSGYILTDVELSVLDVLKGQAATGDTLIATLLGGALGNVGLTVPGEANLPEGKSAIVFLRRASNGDLNVTGMSQGVMPIEGAGSSAQVMPAGNNGATLVQKGSDGKLREAPDAIYQPRALGSVLSEIRGMAATH